MTREECLNEAIKITTTDRNVQYGDPEDNFMTIADLWSVYLEKPLTAVDVANLMVLFKIARNKANPKDDNWVDICGYAACGCEIVHSNKDIATEMVSALNRKISEFCDAVHRIVENVQDETE